MNFDEKFTSLQELVEDKIKDYIRIKEPKSLYEPFSYIMEAGGKRIRPILTMVAAGAIGADPISALNCGVAIEILHNFTLVHDDIMDKSPIRRNRPTVHMKWNDSIAILTGDMMVGYAYTLLPFGSEHPRTKDILEIFSNALIEVCEGQVYDMEFGERNDVSLDEYISMITQKTSRLLEACVLMGANIANASPEQLKALDDYAINVGLAFQVQDDILDMSADQLKFGKKIGQDIIEGKKTYLIIKAKEIASEQSDIELLDLYLNSHGLNETYVNKFQELFQKLGIYEIAQNAVDDYFNKGLESLKLLPDNEYTKMLEWFVHKLNKRVF